MSNNFAFGYQNGGTGGGGGGGDVTQDELNTTNHNVTLTNWQMQNQLNLTQLPQKDGFVDYFVDETHTNTTDTTLVYDAAGDLYTNPAVVVTGGYDFNVEMNLANGTTAMNDLSQNNLTITGYGGIDFETDAGAYNGASTSLVFDGSTQYLYVNDDAVLDIAGDEDLIVELAFSKDTVGAGGRYLLARYESDTNKKSWFIAPTGTNGIQFMISSDGSTDTWNYIFPINIQANTWYHCLFILNAQDETLTLYLDGKFFESVSCTANPFQTDTGVTIGARSTNGATTIAAGTYFDGKIGLARIASGDKRYLGTADTDNSTRGEDLVLQATGNADASTTFTDLSSTGNTLTGNNVSWTNDASPYSDNHATSVVFDQTDSRISGPSSIIDPTADYTFEFIIWRNSATINELCGQQTAQGSNGGFILNMSSDGNNLNFYRYFDGTTLNGNISVTTLGLALNTWYHIRATYSRSSADFKVYVNGDLASSDTASNTTGDLFASTADFCIGKAPDRTSGDYKLAGFKFTNAIVPATMLSDYESLKQFPVDNDTNYDHLVLDMNQANASTTFTDLSANSTTITAFGSLAHSRNGTYQPNRSVLRFDGTDDYLQIDGTGLDMNDDFTVEGVFRFSQVGTTPIYPFFYGDGTNDTNKSRFIMLSTLGDINLYNSADGSALVNTINADCGTAFLNSVGDWLHLRVTYEHSTASVRVYKDGVLVGSSLNNTVTTVYTATQEDIFLGRRNTTYNDYEVAAYRLSNGIQEPVFFTDPFTDLTVTPPSTNGNYVSLTELADTAPSEIRLLCLIQTDGTLNTDVIGEVSRDGGTTWTQVTLQYTVAFEGSVNCAASDPVSVAGQPSGTNIVGRIRSINEVNTDIHGISMGW